MAVRESAPCSPPAPDASLVVVLATNRLTLPLPHPCLAGHKDLKNTCPDEVRVLLTKKSLFDVYDKFVQSIVDTRNTRSSVLGKWKDAEFVGVLDQFSDDFAEKGVRVALCKRTSGKGTYRWLEFIDVDAMGDAYEPQYDYSNRSGQIIKTCYTKLKFPNGVAVEELKVRGCICLLRRRIGRCVSFFFLRYVRSHGKDAKN